MSIVVIRIRWLALTLFLLLMVLTINGSLPWLLSPTFGQALWASGFAKSFSNVPFISVYASNIGAPAPAAIAFGLSAALPIAIFLKLGMLSVNAYAMAFALWLTIAFWGGYKLARVLKAPKVIALLCSTLWLTMPVVWAHQSYSMLALGLALLPFYIYAAWNIIWPDQPSLGQVVLFLSSCIIAVFMDGYSYMMYAMACGLLFVVASLTPSDTNLQRFIHRSLILTLGFSVSFLLYSIYMGHSKFTVEPLDFFRAWGANIEFLLIPTRGISLVADVLGLSEARQEVSYFGDSSVFLTTFSSGLVVAALIGFITRAGDWRWKLAFCVIAVAAFYLSLGPSFKFYAFKPTSTPGPLMPEAFAPIATGTGFLSENLPGFENMRASYRWVGLGAFAAWAIFVTSFSRCSTPFAWPTAVLTILIVINVPPIERIRAYKQAREDFLDADRLVEAERPAFRVGETVAFVPKGNDFFLTYLVPNLHIRSFNIGGDKNVATASVAWPTPFARFSQVYPGYNIEHGFTEKVEALLESNVADAVALSYINNWEPSQHWPVPTIFKDELLRLANRFGNSSRYDVINTKYYTIIRLRSGVKALGDIYIQPHRVPLELRNQESLTIARQRNLSKFFRARGWSELEDFGVWSTDKNATLFIRIPKLNEHPLRITVKFTPYAPRATDEKRVRIMVNGRVVFIKKYSGPPVTATEQIVLTDEIVNTDGTATVEFQADPLFSPADFGGGDTRKLGVMLHGLYLN